MQTCLHLMPIDRTKISTQLRIHPDLLDDPSDYIRKHDLPIRTSKASRGNSKLGPTRNLNLKILTHKGIEVELRKSASEPLTGVTIHFNPGACLRAHNGSVLTLTEFLHALAILSTQLKPLLCDTEDWVDLIPGLRVGGIAHWSYLEILLQCADPDGTILAGLRNAQGNSTNTKIRHWPESMMIGSKRSELQFEFYRKALEMVAKDNLPPEMLDDYRHILRLEVRMKGKKLIELLGNERTVEEINGKPRLVRFYPLDVVSGDRAAFDILQGVFRSSGTLEALKPKDQPRPLHRLLARISLDPRTSLTFQQLLLHIRFYTKASTDTIGKIRKGGIATLESLSTITKDELLSDTAFQKQQSVWSKEREKKILHEADDAFVHPLIRKAYQPPNLPFQPITQLPEYLRV